MTVIGINDIDARNWEIVAQVGHDVTNRARWTELRIYFTPDRAMPFVAETLGCTTVAGEVDRVRRREYPSVDKALKLFDKDSNLTDQITSLAQRWLVHNEKRVAAYYDRKVASKSFGGDTFTAALSWLYPDVSGPDRPRLLALEKDFGIPLRTGQHLLKIDKAGEEMPAQMGAFLRALRYFNRDAWQRQKETA